MDRVRDQDTDLLAPELMDSDLFGLGEEKKKGVIRWSNFFPFKARPFLILSPGNSG